MSATRRSVSAAVSHMSGVTTSTGRTGRPSGPSPVPCRFSRGQPSFSATGREAFALASSASIPSGVVRSPVR